MKILTNDYKQQSSYIKLLMKQQYITSSWIPVIMSRWLRVCSVTPVTMSCACVLSLWTPVAMSWRSSRPEVRRPASGWGSLLESSSFAPWLILNTFRDVSGVVPEWPCSSGFMRKSSSLASAPSIRFSVLLNSCDNFLVILLSFFSENWVI